MYCSPSCGVSARTESSLGRECVICGSIYKSLSRSSQCCSPKCARAKQAKTMRERAHADCKWCGVSFYARVATTTERAECCSKLCSARYRHKPKWLLKARCDHGPWSQMPGRECGVCGAWMDRPRGDRKYCSQKCMSLAYGIRHHDAKQCECAECGKGFATEYGNKLRAYCSHSCSRTAGNRENRHRNREARQQQGARRRERKRSGTMSIKVRRPGLANLAERDQWRCGICRLRVDMERRYPDPLSPSLDHILPLSQGGRHERSNVQLSHLGCNVKKNDGRSGSQMRMFG